MQFMNLTVNWEFRFSIREYDVEALAELFRKGDMEGGRAKMRHDMVHFIQEVTEEQLNSILDKIGECKTCTVSRS